MNQQLSPSKVTRTRNQMKRVRIMIADNDTRISQVVRSTLCGLGFENITLVQTQNDALSGLKQQPYDFVIMDWNISPLDSGLFVRNIRTNPGMPNPTIPIIMLTARGMMQDVYAARDLGVTEYLLKPFTAESLCNRITQIVEYPRPFVIAPTYNGPDRRRKGRPPEGVPERRSTMLPMKNEVEALSKNITEACILPPNDSLRQKLDLQGPLSAIINTNLISRAQQMINDNRNMSVEWMKDDLISLEKAYADVQAEREPEKSFAQLQNTLLSIKACAGTFGYDFASEVAWSLYRFTRERLSIENPNHRVVITKHIQALKVAIANRIQGKGGAVEQTVMQNLTQMIKENSTN